MQCAQAFPSENRQPRQDEDGESGSGGFNPVNVGASVAQIIAGAFTGNIDSIIKGSFGFIDDPNVNKLSHNTWETLKGNPTKTPPWASTTELDADADSETEAPSPSPPPAAPPAAPPKIQELATPPTKAAAVAIVESEPAPVIAVAPPKRKVVAYRPVVEEEYSFGSQSGSAGSVYFAGSGDYPTKSPVRSTQPTYATLAPLSVIHGITEPEPNTQRTTTEEEDDGDEAEAFSAEY